jgi:hypothetical protein
MRMRCPVLRKLTLIFSFWAVSLTQGYVLAAQVIPPIRGRIVDATSGAPIEGIEVELQFETSEGWTQNIESKETAKTDSSGVFSLAGPTHPAKAPFDEFESYWLVVNGGPGENSPQTQVLYNPLVKPTWFSCRPQALFSARSHIRACGLRQRLRLPVNSQDQNRMRAGSLTGKQALISI